MANSAEHAIFREIEHTGDIGIEIDADSRAELFRRAALTLARLMVDTSTVRTLEFRDLSIPAAEDVDLMHDLLSALLQLFMIETFTWSDAQLEEHHDGLSVRLHGELFDPHRHEFYQEIKAITYHELVVRNEDGRWFARVIFDV
jgi:SHS2 domain-containing protein